MRAFFHQHLFHQLIATLCLFMTLSNCAEGKSENFPLLKEDGELIRKCEEMNPEDMIKHVYVYGDSPDGIQLKCPVPDKQFAWDEKLQAESQYEMNVYNPSMKSNKYTVSGDSLETYALNIVKPEKSFSGIYCCKKSDGFQPFPFLSHAVFVFSKAPNINLTVSKLNPKKGDEISLQCSDPPKNLPDGYPKPSLFWEKNSVESNEFSGPKIQFTVTPEDHGSSFRCGWKYDKLANNGGSRTFYSNLFSLEVEFLFIVEQLSTNNSDRIDVLPGNSTTLKCVVKAYPPRVGWRWTKVPFTKSEVDIDDSLEGKFIISRTEYGLTTTLSLTVNDFSKEDAASYSCKQGEEVLRVFNVEDERYSPQQPTIGPWKNTASSNDQFLSVGLILISLLTTALLT